MNTTFRIGLIFVLTIISIGVFYRILIAAQGMTITSWFRTFAKNREVGGVKNSLHQVGLAWDVLPVNFASVEKLQSMGLKVIDEKTHLHAQLI